MKLDFTKLNNITGSPTDVFNQSCNREVSIDDKNATVVNVGTLNNDLIIDKKEEPKKYLKIEREAEKYKEDMERARQAYGYYQENTKRSCQLRSEINKDIKSGKDTHDILLKAIECISLMTGDTVFYKQNSTKLKERELK